MKTIFILFSVFLFMGCSSSVQPGINRTAKGGSAITEKILSKKEKEYKDLKDKVTDKEDDLSDAEKDLEEAEEDLEEAKDNLEEINAQLRNSRLTAEQRAQLLRDKATAEQAKTRAETALQEAEQAKARAETALQEARTAHAQALERERREHAQALERERTAKETALREANTERDCWKRTTTSFCARTDSFKTRFFANKDDHTPAITAENCNDVNICDLEDITVLDLSGSYDPDSDSSKTACNNNGLEFNKNDFIGFTKVTELKLNKNCLSCGSGWDSCLTTNLPDKTNEGIFSHLSEIRKIKLHDTSVVHLPRNFFTSGNITKLINGGVTVTGFIYCNEATVKYIDKLGSDKTAHDSYRPALSSACY